MNQKETVSNLNSLLRGELAAAETYQQAMDKVGRQSQSGTSELRIIRDEHRTKASEISEHVQKFGGQPDKESGAWGTFAETVMGTANIIGQTAALKALKEGEKQGIRTYERMLKNADMPGECCILIEDSIERCQAHVAILDRLMTRDESD